MKKQPSTPRERLRNPTRFPIGMYVGLLVAACITLVGVCLQLDPAVILVRASLSSLLVGALVSFGISVLGLMEVEHKKRNRAQR